MRNKGKKPSHVFILCFASSVPEMFVCKVLSFEWFVPKIRPILLISHYSFAL